MANTNFITTRMRSKLSKIPLGIDVLRSVRNWRAYFSDYFESLDSSRVEYELRNGTRCVLRPGTSDRMIFNDIWLRRVYCRENTIRPNDVVIDIGAQIGLFSLFAASRSARVYSFEPFPENFSMLKENIARNHLEDRVLPFRLAVWSTLGQVELYRSDLSGSHSVMVRSSASVHAETTTLERIMNDHRIGRCGLLKIDAEGSEYPILYTTPRDVLARVDRISLEWHDLESPAMPQYEHNSLKRFLEGQGFRVATQRGLDVFQASRIQGN